MATPEREGRAHRGHDFKSTVRYKEFAFPAGQVLCHDCDRPIPAGVRAYRRIDVRQDHPVVCEPCREQVNATLYNRAEVRCTHCGEGLRYAHGVWVHASTGMIVKRLEVVCPDCGGARCRLCLNTGKIQRDDHNAEPEGVSE